MLVEQTLFGVRDKVALAIERVREFEPAEGYYLAFSGGKDSCALKQVAIESGVKFDAHYNVTTIDPPDLVKFIRREHPDVAFDHPETPFLVKMATKGFPTRVRRWCCEAYKERGGDGRRVLTGVRWAESPRRAKRSMTETCYRDAAKTYIHPIIDWTDQDVWEYIRDRDLPYCHLYDEGIRRLGCLACPMAPPRDRKADMRRYPGYERAFRRAFQRLFEHKRDNGLRLHHGWRDGDDMFEWWLSDCPAPNEAQLTLYE